MAIGKTIHGRKSGKERREFSLRPWERGGGRGKAGSDGRTVSRKSPTTLSSATQEIRRPISYLRQKNKDTWIHLIRKEKNKGLNAAVLVIPTHPVRRLVGGREVRDRPSQTSISEGKVRGRARQLSKKRVRRGKRIGGHPMPSKGRRPTSEGEDNVKHEVAHQV